MIRHHPPLSRCLSRNRRRLFIFFVIIYTGICFKLNARKSYFVTTHYQRLIQSEEALYGALSSCNINFLMFGNETTGLDIVDNSAPNVLDVRVCLVVTTLHSREYVETTIESIKQQSHRNIEIFIVDDRSDNETINLAKRHEHISPNSSDLTLQVIALSQKRNGEMGQPANIGIEACSSRADYVMFLKGGDLMKHDAIRKMIFHAQTLKSHLVIADFNNMGAMGDPFVGLESEAMANFPQDKTFNVFTHPHVLLLSPVSSRKLYSTLLFQEFHLGYYEGDYDFEENGLHWSSILHASRISKLNLVLFHLRQISNSQTVSSCQSETDLKRWGTKEFRLMYSERSRLAGYFPIFFKIGALIFNNMDCETSTNQSNCINYPTSAKVSIMYFTWLNQSRWIAERQCSHSMTAKFNRRIFQIGDHWLMRTKGVTPNIHWETLQGKIPPNLLSRSIIDLSIIIPTFNVVEFIEDLIVSMYENLVSTKFEFEVFIVDDGSVDGTIDILEKYDGQKSNFYFLCTTGQKGAGFARNMAVPLVEGRYVYFADSDDAYDFKELLRAVNFATQHKKDLLLFPSKMEYITPKISKIGGMMQNDVETWKKALSSPLSQDGLKQFALDLTGYPWKQLTCSNLIFKSDSFFGPTSVHNDINFHWLTVALAENMHFYETPIPTHRKFNNGLRGQISQIKSEARMRLFDAVALTQRALARQGVFDHGSNGVEMLRRWESFSEALFQWGSSRVPESVVGKYQSNQAEFLKIFEDAKINPKTLNTWRKKEY